MIARMLPVLLFFVLILAFLAILTREEQPAENATLRAVPQVALVDFVGKPVVLSQGKWVLVNFFASWCVPCVLEHPQLMELKDKLTIIGINYRDQTVNAKAFLAARGNPYAHVATDGKGEAALAFGIAGVPESYLINPDGQIVWHAAGPVMQSQLQEILEAIHAR